MSDVASVSFTHDGTETEFARLYDAISDRSAHSPKARPGVIEFMIDDFSTFKGRVASESAELGIDLVAHDYLVSEPRT